MLNSLHRAAAERTLDLTAYTSRPRVSDNRNVFKKNDLAATPDVVTRRVFSSAATKAAARQVSVTSSADSPEFVVSNASASSTASAKAPSATSTPAASTPKRSADDTILETLKGSLSAAGINYSDLGLAVHSDTVTYPGGSYINRYISVNVNGHEEGLMTDLVGAAPNIAVNDIKRMLGNG